MISRKFRRITRSFSILSTVISTNSMIIGINSVSLIHNKCRWMYRYGRYRLSRSNAINSLWHGNYIIGWKAIIGQERCGTLMTWRRANFSIFKLRRLHSSDRRGMNTMISINSRQFSISTDLWHHLTEKVVRQWHVLSGRSVSTRQTKRNGKGRQDR